MMARYRLVGEGPDDVAVFVALVNRYGLPLADKGKQVPDKLVIDWPGGDAAVLRKLRNIDDEDQWLLEHVQTLLKPRDLTAEDRFGIVVDADHPKAADPDDGLQRRWIQVRERLRTLGYTDVPEEPDPTGTIVGTNQTDRPWVGVWMMPDNRSPGKLEDFARRLVRSGDEGLWDHAAQATAASMSQGAKFAPKDQAKAHVHTFLAWQDVPGVPMGLAITKQFLDADSPDARNFVVWLCRLYGFASTRLTPP
jgi:hypothetical protein